MGITFEDWRAQAARFSFGGYRIAYWQAGQGETPLLLIHGFPTASWDWALIWEDLSKDYHCIAADMLGFGLTDKPRPFEYRISTQADLQLALLKELRLKECHILAHDYGVSVAQELIARADEGKLGGINIKSVCFLNGGLFPDAHHPRPIQKLLGGRFGPLLVKFMSRKSFGKSFSAVFGKETKPSAQELDQFWALINEHEGKQVMPLLLDYMVQRRTHESRWVGHLQTTEIPLRLINGVEDPVSGGHLADYYEKVIPKPDVVRLDGIGHYPQVESPESVLSEFNNFCLIYQL